MSLTQRTLNRTQIGWLIALAALVLLSVALSTHLNRVSETRSYIVQGQEQGSARSSVLAVGGEITHELPVIRAVAADLTRAQLARLSGQAAVQRIHANRSVKSTGKPTSSKKTPKDPEPVEAPPVVPALIGADLLHEEGIDGSGITVAVLDSGIKGALSLIYNSSLENRLLAHYDAMSDRLLSHLTNSDGSGHGTHVASIILDSLPDGADRYNGIAPAADLVVVKAFDEYGQGSYADVIRGIDWIVANRETYGIRVLNLSFGATLNSYYWDDPMNQAVMVAWQAGIVVVVAAGNEGPYEMTIGAPANVPYVVTVGAMTDNETPTVLGDDQPAWFTSLGPTVENHIKPDLVAPGGRVRGIMDFFAQIALEHSEYHDGELYFTMSGTSQATAVVSGVAALILQESPDLSPDDVKCRLMASADPFLDADGSLTYSAFQQGTGVVHAYDAVYSTETGCANRGLNIAKDLSGEEHYVGMGDPDLEGNFTIEDWAGEGASSDWYNRKKSVIETAALDATVAINRWVE